MAETSNKPLFPIVVLSLQVLFFVLFAVFVEYGPSASPPPINGTHADGPALPDFYPMFQDVHVMIFIGFGFLMMFLKRYGFSSVGLNMIIAAICIQWATLVAGLVHHHGATIHVDITTMLTADFASAAVLITFGALLGKTSPLQMVVIAIIEIILFAVNEYIGLEILQVVDVGGSMFVHAFGAYFGLAVARVLHNPEVEKSDKEGSVYHSDQFAMVGTIFLWLFWPSFNSALAVEDAQHRAVLNTYFALAACCVVAFAVSSLVDKDGKFDMVHVQNATLAGGVAVGTSADMMVQPYGALIIGGVAGALSVVGYKYISPFLASKLKIHDTCGVNNLHGMPALMAGITGAIVTAMATVDTYGTTLTRQFPAMGDTIVAGETIPGRTAGVQAGYQMLALGVTLAFAIVGGLIVGLIIKASSCLGQSGPTHFFEDTPTWHVPDEEEAMTPLVSKVIARMGQNGNETPLLAKDFRVEENV